MWFIFTYITHTHVTHIFKMNIFVLSVQTFQQRHMVGHCWGYRCFTEGHRGLLGILLWTPGKEAVHRNSTGNDTLSVRGSGHPTVHTEDAGQSQVWKTVLLTMGLPICREVGTQGTGTSRRKQERKQPKLSDLTKKCEFQVLVCLAKELDADHPSLTLNDLLMMGEVL